MLLLPFVSLLVCWLASFVFAGTRMEQGCDLPGVSKKGKDASPQRARFSKLGGLAPLKRSSLSLSLSFFSRAYIRALLHLPLLLSYFLLGPCSLGMAMSVLHFLYLAGPYPWNVGNVWFTFSLCVIALCMMYVYLYLLVYGWLFTLYDGISWLCEWPSLVVRAPNLVVQVWA